MTSLSDIRASHRRLRKLADEYATEQVQLRTLIAAARADGFTLQAIADALGLTRARIWSILNPRHARRTENVDNG